MANLNSALGRARNRPCRQSVGRHFEARSVGIGRDAILKRMAASAIGLRESPALGGIFGKTIRTAIGYASRNEKCR